MQPRFSRALRRMMPVVLLLLGFGISSVSPATSHGTFATSDYRVSWSDRWHSTSESTTNLILSDGITYVHMVGIFESTAAELSVPELIYDWFTNVIAAEDVTEVESVTSLSPERAFSIFTYRYRVSEQQLDPYAVYFEARFISPGLLLWIVVDTQLGLYRADPSVFDSAVSSLYIDGEPSQSPPAQSFASGPWHISVPSAVLDDSIPSLGLSSVAGNRWLIVLTDIANAGSMLIPFEIDSAVIETENGTRIVPSQIDSQIVNATLQLDDPLTDTAAIAPDVQVRLALVYQVPEGASQLRLSVADQWLSIVPLIDPQMSVGELPPRPEIPPLQRGLIEGWNDDATLRVKTEDGVLQEFVLLGASIPPLEGCYGPESREYLQTLVGATVAIELDPAVLSSKYAYVWIDDSTASPTLLNRHLLDMGIATIVALPEHARFAMWLKQTDATAQVEGRGRWTACT